MVVVSTALIRCSRHFLFRIWVVLARDTPLRTLLKVRCPKYAWVHQRILILLFLNIYLHHGRRRCYFLLINRLRSSFDHGSLWRFMFMVRNDRIRNWVRRWPLWIKVHCWGLGRQSLLLLLTNQTNHFFLSWLLMQVWLRFISYRIKLQRFLICDADRVVHLWLNLLLRRRRRWR